MRIRNRYLLGAGVALLLSLLVGALTARHRLERIESERATSELTAAAEVTQELVRNRNDRLATYGDAMATAPALSGSLAAADRSATLEVLASLAADEREVSFLIVAPVRGNAVSWSAGVEPGAEFAQHARRAAAGLGSHGSTVDGGRLTVYSSLPIRDSATGDVIAGLVVGSRIEQEAIERLGRLTATEMVIIAGGAPVASTLRPTPSLDYSALADDVEGPRTVEIDGDEYVVRLAAADRALDASTGLVMLRSLEARRALDRFLLLDLALSAVVGSLAALVLIWLGSRRLHRALGDLTEAMAETAATGRLGRDSLEKLDQRWAGTEVDDVRAAFRALMQTVEESLRDRERSYVEAIGAVVAAIDARDHETTGHSFRVAHYALALARSLGVERHQLRAIEWGSLLHDVGKIAIPDAILRKTGRLTEDEWHVMRQHPSWGFEMLADVQFLEPALEIVYSHHERWDGGGYPRGLEREQIPLAARIFSVVDTYDSITSDRPYRRARSHGEAIIELCRVAGTQLDPEVVEAFIRLPEVELRRLRERSERLDLKLRIPEVLADLSLADDGAWG